LGLFDSLANKLTGGSGQLAGAPAGLAGAALELLDNSPGGLAGLVGQFESQGLGKIMSSWISTGANLPISAEQLQGALGGGAIQQLAAKVGLSPQEVTSRLTNVLPTLVDKLTPNGQLPTGNLMQAAQGLLGGLLGGQK
jgi:uncharacterized protein YidB (DUF937 family)